MPGGDVVEMPLRVEGRLGGVGVSASQPVRRRGKCSKFLFDEVKDEVSLEYRPLLLKTKEHAVIGLGTKIFH